MPPPPSRLIPGAILLIPILAAAQAPVTDCDREGAHPGDPEKIQPGIFWSVLDGPRVIGLCEQALKQYPDDVRLIYQLGRALARADRNDEAVVYLTRAAEAGYEIAYTTLAGLYRYSFKNYAEAAYWYKEGAEIGSATAQNGYADMFLLGQGVPKDPRQAFDWYMQAARQGYALSESNLGYLYEHGEGVQKDLTRAADYYHQAATKNLPRGQYNFGRMLHNGMGVDRNIAEAIRWYEKAAEQGYGWSELDLGYIYENGDGVSKDPAVAYEWYARATRHNNPEIQVKGEQGMKRLKRSVARGERKQIESRVFGG